jgi:hypothetical protein
LRNSAGETAAGDAAAAVRLARLVLPRHQAAVGRHLLATGEAAGVPQVGHHRLGGAWADARDGLQQTHARVRLGQGVELGLGLVNQRLGLTVLGQGQLQQAAPQLVGGTLGQGLGVLRDARRPDSAQARAPRGAGKRKTDQDSADAVLGGAASTDQGLAAGDEGTPLAGLLGRDDDGGELSQGLQLGQAEGVVLALSVLRLVCLNFQASLAVLATLQARPSSAQRSCTQPARAQASMTTTAGRCLANS